MNKNKLFFTLLMLSLPLAAHSDSEEQRPIEGEQFLSEAAAHALVGLHAPPGVPGTLPMAPVVGAFSITPSQQGEPHWVGQTHAYEPSDSDDDLAFASDLEVEEVDSSDDESWMWQREE